MGKMEWVLRRCGRKVDMACRLQYMWSWLEPLDEFHGRSERTFGNNRPEIFEVRVGITMD